MSISVKNLTKRYGDQLAVNNLSFEAQPGEVVGFLGPNGAGKSTTMKIITGYLPDYEGDVEVCGFNVKSDPIEVKRRVGYLPETNPLYLDMFVREFLIFLANITKTPAKRVDEMIEITGLGPEQHKRIGALSKGYRQRVGLAQAIIHDPEVLILDEPTTGFDVNQLVDVRSVIKDLGKRKTVLLSTHIMQEVELLCDRVIIIDKGLIRADEPVDALRNSARQKAIYVRFSGSVSQNALRGIPGVMHARPDGEAWILESKPKTDLSKVVFDFAVKRQLTIIENRPITMGLEEVFRNLTKAQ
ncbi:MAG: ATP-binding cassette domain-containing protein [Flavobacteriales bacterium]|nr:MAG: ATP-binding cassette domain-containing protein [Flavobacteriales bacterium]